MKKKELKIDLGIFGRTVIGQVVEMDDSERGIGLLLRLDNNKIMKELKSCEFPDLEVEKIFYVRGAITKLDNQEFIRTYGTEEEAQQAYEDILRLVDEYNKHLNKPKFEESEEYKRQVEINKLLMDMRKWQFENDEKVDPTIAENLYWIYVNIVDCVKIKIDYSKIYRDIGVVYFSSREKAKECLEVFENRIKSIYRNGGND